jgi:hypothetical protein
MAETEVIDRLFLELSRFTKATTGKELALRTPLELAVDNGANWTLEDWRNWRAYHASPTLTALDSSGE